MVVMVSRARILPALFMLVLLLLALPVAPAHDKEGAGQWDVECFDPEPTSASLTRLSTRNLGYSPGELDVWGDLLVVSSRSDSGFHIYRTTDPVNPTLVGNGARWTYILDMKVSENGQNVYVGTFGALEVYDISNPSSPRYASSVDLPFPLDQGHMVATSLIGGTEYVFAASQSGSGVFIFEASGAASARSLKMVAQFAPGSPLGAHDMWVQHDPVLGAPILYVANGLAGWIAADVSDPALPIPLAVVPNPDAGQSYLHTVQAQWIDGRRIVATIAELGGNILRVWDATVLSAPVLLGTWSAPADLPVVPSPTSQHNIQIVDGRLFMAHYRCGFYVFDLRALPELPLLGVDPTLPGLLSPVAHFAPVTTNGQHWDIVLRNGHIYTSDMRLGQGGAFHVVAYDGIPLGDATMTSSG